MRKITRNMVLLFVVIVIYFGYAGWIDGAALYNIEGVQWGGAGWADKLKLIFGEDIKWTELTVSQLRNMLSGTEYSLAGFMAPNSLMKSLLDPFKLVLVGGVFAMLIPLTKQIFFGQITGLKEYLKARRSNVLFNYQSAITWATDLNSKLSLGDYEQIKAHYAGYSGLKFKPQFMTNMVDEIGDSLIKEMDLSIYVKPSEVVINSLKEMYEKERALAIVGRADEMFFDFKRGYEFTSVGSKYSIAYYKALPTDTSTKTKLAWKLFSLEMFRFYVFMLAAIIPTIIISGIALPLIGGLGTGAAAEIASPLVIFLTFFGSAIILHALFTLTKTAYKNLKKEIMIPAITYYFLLILIAISLAAGMVGIRQVGQMGHGEIWEPGTTGTLMWPFFSALGYFILSSCLAMYILSTLMDAHRSPEGMTKKLLVDGIVLPAIAWVIATGSNFTGLFWQGNSQSTVQGILASINSITLVGFWIYLSFSNVLLNNIVLPSARKKLALQAELAEQGQEAKAKKDAQT
ncbi:hypothetical protein [Mesoplasma syrphidae]|nr:hypothetical protein [Mesoplasma syrphidae]